MFEVDIKHDGWKTKDRQMEQCGFFSWIIMEIISLVKHPFGVIKGIKQVGTGSQNLNKLTHFFSNSY